jgi:hypothetical protein
MEKSSTSTSEQALGRVPRKEAAFLQQVNEVAAEIIERLDAERQDKREQRDRSDVNYASELGHSCQKRLVHARLDWNKKSPIDIDGMYRIAEGNQAEWQLAKDLGDVGFKLNESQRSFGIPELNLRGRVDGILPLNRRLPASPQTVAVPAEIKTINPNYWDSTRTIEDIKQHRAWWIRGYPSQLNAYLYSSSNPFGFFILKTFGKRPRILPMLKDQDLWDHDVAKLRAVNKHVEAGTYPEPIPFDSQICGMCDFAHLCQPLKATEFRTIEESDEPLLENYIMLKEWNERFEHAKATLIGSKDKPGKYWGINGVLHDIAISSITQQRTMYDVPADVKAPFGRKQDVNITTIERII